MPIELRIMTLFQVFFIGSKETTSGNSSFSSASSSSDVIRGISSASEPTLSKEKSLMSEKISERALLCLKYINLEYQKLELKNDIQSRVRNDLDQQQREYYLHQLVFYLY